jgi:cytochrome c biogenesis protein CcmG/thiol:disulfide interchange protein DsbE
MKKPLFLLLVVTALLVWIALRRPSAPPVGRAGELRPAPDFSLTDLAGNRLHLSDYRGHVVLLDFWATWCDPCKREIPHFVEMQNRYGPRGLQVIGISMDDDDKLAREFQEQFKMNYPVAMGSAELASQYGGILGLPITYLIDREGRIAARHIGATEAPVFEAEIKKLLASTPVPQ